VGYQVVLPENRKMKDYASMTRFETTDKKIATISSSGKITAKSILDKEFVLRESKMPLDDRKSFQVAFYMNQ